ncbi:uncharacterized protein DDB_G0290685-like [Hydractinia symbiolongicarpus]|uniref:uncharacterized protein DDB_G0290685-like n=1 Tax=Hydractinia symbiolongicarpus TaxID=13093 RepID=UPI00254C3C27|nr:uncharacterized protein DDB_G0290685-like [Hydractinia symbiolongicarpus]
MLCPVCIGKRHLSHSNNLRNHGNNEEKHEEKDEGEDEEEEDEDTSYNIDCYKEKHNHDDKDDGSDGCAETKPKQQDSGYILSQGSGTIRCIDHGSKYDSSAGSVNGYQNNSDMQEAYSHMTNANGYVQNRASGDNQKDTAGNVSGYQNNSDVQEVYSHMANANDYVENTASGDNQTNSEGNVNDRQNNSDMQEVYTHMANANGNIENRAPGDYQKDTAWNVNGYQNNSDMQEVYNHMANANDYVENIASGDNQTNSEGNVNGCQNNSDMQDVYSHMANTNGYVENRVSGDYQKTTTGIVYDCENNIETEEANIQMTNAKKECDRNQNQEECNVFANDKIADKVENKSGMQEIQQDKESYKNALDSGSQDNFYQLENSSNEYLVDKNNHRDDTRRERYCKHCITTELTGKDNLCIMKCIELMCNKEKKIRCEDNSGIANTQNILYHQIEKEGKLSDNCRNYDIGCSGQYLNGSKKQSCSVTEDDRFGCDDISNEQDYHSYLSSYINEKDVKAVTGNPTGKDIMFGQNTTEKNGKNKEYDQEEIKNGNKKVDCNIDNNKEKKHHDEDNRGSVCENNRKIQYDDTQNTIGNDEKKHHDEDNRGSVCENSRKIQYGDARNTNKNKGEMKHHDEDNRENVYENSRKIHDEHGQNRIDNNNETKHHDEDNRESRKTTDNKETNHRNEDKEIDVRTPKQCNMMPLKIQLNIITKRYFAMMKIIHGVGNCQKTRGKVMCHQRSYSNFNCIVDQNERSMED